MNRTEIEAAVAEKTGISKKIVTEVLQSVMDVSTESLKRGEDVRFTGWLTLKTVVRPERTAKNPRTNETVLVAEQVKVKMKPGKNLEAALNA